MVRCWLAAAFLVLLSGGTLAVRSGDEQFGSAVNGYFYVFADRAIHVVNPQNLTVVKNITRDHLGLLLTNEGALGGSANTSRTWNDVVYAEGTNATAKYLFVNEGDAYNSTNGTLFSYVTVISTVQQAIVARIPVHQRPVHIYSVTNTKDIWTHSDAAGVFDVIDVDNASGVNASAVPGLATRPGHGKLLVDVALYPKAYASNVNEPVLQSYDLAAVARNGTFNFSAAAPGCLGTHSLVYSNFSQHAFFECVGSGTLEWDTRTDKLVKYHTNVTGYLSALPADDKILSTNSDTSEANVFVSQGNSQPSLVSYTIIVPGNPAPPVFYSNASSPTPEVAEDYTIFFPLNRITNINNVRAADVTAEGYFEQPTDCQYATPTVSAASLTTSSVSGLQLAQSNGAVATPQCGACAPGTSPPDASQFNASLSGFGVTNFSSVEAAAATGMDGIAVLLPAGSILVPRNGASTANACSFSEVNRAVERGGPFVATVADFPRSSLQVVDASAKPPRLYGTVPVNSSPRKVSWVPA